MAQLQTVDETQTMLSKGAYVADRSLATALYLSLSLKRPLFLEGEAGVGKTELAKVLAKQLDRRLIRLQCYEGLDVAGAVLALESLGVGRVVCSPIPTGSGT